MSWSYDPMLGVEVSEIGATLIALSVPGFKPLVDKYILRKDVSAHSGGSKYQMQGGRSRRSRGTAMSTLRLRSQHSMLASTETDTYCSENACFKKLVKSCSFDTDLIRHPLREFLYPAKPSQSVAVPVEMSV